MKLIFHRDCNWLIDKFSLLDFFVDFLDNYATWFTTYEKHFCNINWKVFIPLQLTGAAAVDAGIHKKHGSWKTSLITPFKEVEGIMKIIRSLEESGLIIKGFTKTIENVAKEVRSRFLGMVLVKLVPSL